MKPIKAYRKIKHGRFASINSCLFALGVPKDDCYRGWKKKITNGKYSSIWERLPITMEFVKVLHHKAVLKLAQECDGDMKRFDSLVQVLNIARQRAEHIIRHRGN